MLSESLSERSQDRMRMLVLLAGFACSTVSLAAPDEEALGKSRGYHEERKTKPMKKKIS